MIRDVMTLMWRHYFDLVMYIDSVDWVNSASDSGGSKWKHIFAHSGLCTKPG